MFGIRRREFVTLIGGAAAVWPLTARAQPAMPVIGFLHLTSLENNRENLATFRRGLEDIGYIEGKNVAIEYRWAQGRNDQLPSLVGELVHRQVSVIVVLEKHDWSARSQSGHPSDPNCFCAGRRSGPDRSRRKPQPTWGKSHWHRPFVGRNRSEAP
jgi:putative ABC transport system substrate-binding protein